MSLGTADALFREALAFATAPNAQQALAEVAPPSWTDVSLRYQYTPLGLLLGVWEAATGLAAIICKSGFDTIALYPVHYHPLPPAASAEFQKLHIGFSTMVFETAAHDHRLIPFSSSFVLAARKR